MVHVYQNNGYNIALDVNSGCVHVVDDIVYELIPVLEDAVLKKSAREEILVLAGQAIQKKGLVVDEEEIAGAVEEILELAKEEMLYTEDIYEPYIEEFKNRKTVVKALCLHIAHDCNLACRYCFAEEGEYHGRRAFMSYEVGKKALDESGSGLFRRRAFDELAGGQGPGSIRKVFGRTFP